MRPQRKPVSLNLGDHVRYVGPQRLELPAGLGQRPELVLTRGMEGVVLLSTGALGRPGPQAPRRWRCRVQFENGFQIDITPDNRADFTQADRERAALRT